MNKNQSGLTFHNGSRSSTSFTDTDTQVQKNSLLTSNMLNFPTQERLPKNPRPRTHTCLLEPQFQTLKIKIKRPEPLVK